MDAGVSVIDSRKVSLDTVEFWLTGSQLTTIFIIQNFTSLPSLLYHFVISESKLPIFE